MFVFNAQGKPVVILKCKIANFFCQKEYFFSMFRPSLAMSSNSLKLAVSFLSLAGFEHVFRNDILNLVTFFEREAREVYKTNYRHRQNYKLQSQHFI